MPINIPEGLPATKNLEAEKIFIMDENKAIEQDIRPLNIIILNLMPEKEKTELQLLRLLGNSPLQVNVTFMNTATHVSKNVSSSHLDTFYSTFDEIKNRKFDGMIITGAPIEHLEFEDVNYWPELTQILEWTKENVTSVLNICWGAQAALYYHYGINKHTLPKKCSGIYSHNVSDPRIELVRGFDESFLAPHSRYTEVLRSEIEQSEELVILSESDEAGVFMVMSRDGKNIMVTGHLEYDATTLADEYKRDVEKGLDIAMPDNYFPGNDVANIPLNMWRSHTHLLFSNWLNYYVYQATPYQWE